MKVMPLFLLSESLQLSMNIDETWRNRCVLGNRERNRSSKEEALSQLLDEDFS